MKLPENPRPEYPYNYLNVRILGAKLRNQRTDCRLIKKRVSQLKALRRAFRKAVR